VIPGPAPRVRAPGPFWQAEKKKDDADELWHFKNLTLGETRRDMRDTRTRPDPLAVLIVGLGDVARSAVTHLANGTSESRGHLAEELATLARICAELELGAKR